MSPHTARLTSLLTLLLLSACGGGLVGSGRRVTEARSLPAFRTLEVHSAIVVTATKGPPALTLEADDNVIGLVQTEVTGERLVLRLPDSLLAFPSAKPIEVRLSNERYEGVAAAGASKVRFPATRTGTLRLEASGASALEVSDVDADEVLVDLSGASGLRATGRSTAMSLRLTGASQAAARELPVENLSLDLQGASTAAVTASVVQGTLSGASTVDAWGALTRVDVTRSGESTFRRQSP